MIRKFAQRSVAMMAVILLMVAGLSVLPERLAATSHQLAVSTFDTDAEGWTTAFENGQNYPPQPSYSPRRGNPGGFVYASDADTGPLWYWVAPPKFLGDKSEAYGQSLSFDLKQSSSSMPIEAADVILTGGGIVLANNSPVNPPTVWRRYVVPLTDSAGWYRLATLEPATEADLRTVLGSLESIRIRGEYNFGADVDSMDNVILGSSVLYTINLPLVWH